MDYDSVGDWHSTRKISEVEKVEDARHGGHGRECGLHLEARGHGFYCLKKFL